MNPLPDVETMDEGLTPERWDAISDRSTNAAHAYVMAMVEITQGLHEADRDVFLIMSLTSMMRRFEAHGIILDLEDVARAAESVMDDQAFRLFERVVNEALDRSEHARVCFDRLASHIGIERADETHARARALIGRNAARQCMRIAEDAMVF